jgi:hypothetical protein
MPWNIKENSAECRGGYAVVKDSGELVSCHPSRSRAEAHLRGLHASETDSNKPKKSILRGE